MVKKRGLGRKVATSKSSSKTIIHNASKSVSTSTPTLSIKEIILIIGILVFLVIALFWGGTRSTAEQLNSLFNKSLSTSSTIMILGIAILLFVIFFLLVHRKRLLKKKKKREMISQSKRFQIQKRFFKKIDLMFGHSGLFGGKKSLKKNVEHDGKQPFLKKKSVVHVGSYETELDVIYERVQQKGSIRLEEIIHNFKVKKELAEEWAKILESHGLIVMYYPPFGSPILKLPTAPQKEGNNG